MGIRHRESPGPRGGGAGRRRRLTRTTAKTLTDRPWPRIAGRQGGGGGDESCGKGQVGGSEKPAGAVLGPRLRMADAEPVTPGLWARSPTRSASRAAIRPLILGQKAVEKRRFQRP